MTQPTPYQQRSVYLSHMVRGSLQERTSSSSTSLNFQKHEEVEEGTNKIQTTTSLIPKQMRTFGQVVMERSDTFRSAGFYDEGVEHEPLKSGAKTNITLFLLALGYKWYRSIFINKVSNPHPQL